MRPGSCSAGRSPRGPTTRARRSASTRIIEHPPLGKLILAASMLVFGDNGIGWRVPSVIAGMAALGAVYLIVRAAGETAWLGILVTGVPGP